MPLAYYADIGYDGMMNYDQIRIQIIESASANELTQTELARRSGVALPKVNAMFCGRQRLNIDNLLSLASAAGVAVELKHLKSG